MSALTIVVKFLVMLAGGSMLVLALYLLFITPPSLYVTSGLLMLMLMGGCTLSASIYSLIRKKSLRSLLLPVIELASFWR